MKKMLQMDWNLVPVPLSFILEMKKPQMWSLHTGVFVSVTAPGGSSRRLVGYSLMKLYRKIFKHKREFSSKLISVIFGHLTTWVEERRKEETSK
jgi:hypothetical protein